MNYHMLIIHFSRQDQQSRVDGRVSYNRCVQYVHMQYMITSAK